MTEIAQDAPQRSAGKVHLALDRLRERQGAKRSSQRIPRRGDLAGPLPLSFGQESLWFLEQLEPDGSAYLVPAAVRLSGPLQVEVLAASLTEIVRRHEALRTAFRASEGRPYQEVAEPRAVELPVVDLVG